MPQELKERYPFSVDTWTTLSKRKRHHFLTHAHSDHTSRIESFAGREIFCTEITKQLVLRRFPELKSCGYVILEVGESKFVADDEEPFTVTAFDANHCAGAVILLFEGSFGSVLHTGDCRLDDDCLGEVLRNDRVAQHPLDCVFLDCTFGKDTLRMPSKEDAFLQVQQCINDHEEAPVVYLACDLLGHEELLSGIVASFRSKIFVDKRAFPDYFADMMIVAPDLFTQDPQSTRFHICEGYQGLYKRAQKVIDKAKELDQPEPLYIRPSAQWYTFEERVEGVGCGPILSVPKELRNTHRSLPAPKAATRDGFGVWHVCYSNHSCRAELEKAMEKLLPEEVISTTPTCHANEVTSKLAHLRRKKLDTSASNPFHKGLLDERCHIAGDGLQTAIAKPISAASSPVLVRASKKVCRAGASSPKHEPPNVDIPLFGTARHTIPPSPPLTFSSTPSHSDTEAEFDSQSTAEYIPPCYLGDESLDEPEEFCAPDRDCGSFQVDPTKGDDALCRHSRSTSIDLEHRTNPARVILEDSLSLRTAEPIIGQAEAESEAAKTDYMTCNVSVPEKERQDHLSPRDEGSKSNADFTFREGGAQLKSTSKDGMTMKGSVLEKRALSTKVEGNHKQGVALLTETTRKCYRSLFAPIPLPLPSLMDLYNDLF